MSNDTETNESAAADADQNAGIRNRRALLGIGLGGLGAYTVQAVLQPDPAQAASVVLGATNTATAVTTIKNTSRSANHAALSGTMATQTPGVNAAGVTGVNQGTNGNGFGVWGKHSGEGIGVQGTSASGTGVKGAGYIAVHGLGGSYGLYGYGTSYGVYASSATTGVYGYGPSYGVVGETNTGTGVRGVSYSDSYEASAIFGEAFGANNNGVVGKANRGTSAWAIWGESTSGHAGYFSGKVTVTGILAKGGGSFRIDHPLFPETKYLSHSFVESPDMMNVYNGNVVTDGAGFATVRLPAYFQKLNRDFRYQLTVIGVMAQAVVATEIARNRFTIQTSQPNVKVSWQVTGIGQDPFANKNRIKVEEDKPAEERGAYLHPAAYGKPPERDIDHKRIAAVGAQQRKLRR